MVFNKYRSLLNHYKGEDIDSIFNYHPELIKATYVITEKLDGANFQIMITADGDVTYGRRNDYLTLSDKFFNFQSAIERRSVEISMLKDLARDSKVDIIVYCELFGNVNKIKYSEEVDIKIFDIFLLRFDKYTLMSNDKKPYFLSYMELLFYSNYYGFTHLVIPTYEYNAFFKYCLDFEVEGLKSIVNPEVMAEGIVIRPRYYAPFIRIKKKSIAFNEITREKKERPIDEVLDSVYTDFLSYINKNRIATIMTQYGTIQKKSQIREYMNYIIKDALTDFEEDYLNDTGTELKNYLDEKQYKKMLGVGKAVFPLLQKYLKGE